MAEADDGSGNMRPCGCRYGRPCTCEMNRKKKAHASSLACGECVNCLLNARTRTRAASRKPSAVAVAASGAVDKGNEMRKCIHYDEFRNAMTYDFLVLGPDCVFRMKKPDWRWVAQACDRLGCRLTHCRCVNEKSH